MVKNELKLYFDRIGLAISVSPTLEVLTVICQHHTRTIPFENIDPVLGIPIKLDMQAIHQKLLVEKRGGYCFEHSMLLMEVLAEIGYKVRGITSRPASSYNKKNKATRTHMALVVTHKEKDYLIDVGYGSLVPTEPLLLEENLIQSTALGDYKITREGTDFLLQTFVQNHWRPLYIFDLREQVYADFEVANWYISNHPNSYYVNNLMASIVKGDAHYSLNNNRLTTFCLVDNTKEKKILKSPNEVKEAFTNLFHISIDEIAGFENRILSIFSNPDKKVEIEGRKQA